MYGIDIYITEMSVRRGSTVFGGMTKPVALYHIRKTPTRSDAVNTSLQTTVASMSLQSQICK